MIIQLFIDLGIAAAGIRDDEGDVMVDRSWHHSYRYQR